MKSGEEGLWEKRQQREQQEKFRKEEAVVESTAGNFDTEPAGKEAAQFQDQEAKSKCWRLELLRLSSEIQTGYDNSHAVTLAGCILPCNATKWSVYFSLS